MIEELSKNKIQEIINSEEFFIFLIRNMKSTLSNSTTEEIAEFTFGSINNAINELISQLEHKE